MNCNYYTHYCKGTHWEKILVKDEDYQLLY